MLGTALAAQVARWSALAVEPYHQHIHIGPLAMAHVWTEGSSDVDDVQDAHATLVDFVLPHVTHIVAGAPELAAHMLAPLLALTLTPLADAEHDVASAFLQGVGHGAVASARRGTVLGCVAVVILQIVDAP